MINTIYENETDMHSYYTYLDSLNKHNHLSNYYNNLKCNNFNSKEIYAVLSDLDIVSIELGQNLKGKEIYLKLHN